MNKILLASASSLALISAAAAADMPARPLKAVPPVPTWNWQGFYIGINGGVARHEAVIDVSITTPFDHSEIEKTGATFGGQIGLNLQSQNFVYGVEVDWNRVDGAGSNVTTPASPALFVSDLSWLATARGRIGLLIAPPTLAYVTGGLAVGRVRSNWFGTSLVENRTKAGWALGGGIEHMFAPNWTAKAEVLYADLGDTRSAPAYIGRFAHTAWLARLGLNLKW